MGFSSVFVVGNALRLRAFKALSRKPRNENSEEKEIKSENIIEENSIGEKPEKEVSNMNKEISIEGMMCDHCVNHVTKALEGLEGVSKVEVSLDDNKAIIHTDNSVGDEAIKDVIVEAGYEVTGIKEI